MSLVGVQPGGRHVELEQDATKHVVPEPTTPEPTTPAQLAPEHVEFRRALVEAGHLLPLRQQGTWGRGADLERVVLGFVGRLDAMYSDRPQTAYHFGPLMPQGCFQLTGYVSSQPHLVGSVDIFRGGDAAHRELLAECEAGEDWTHRLEPAGLMLGSAACHPLYAALAGQQVSGSYLIYGHAFRHEPSDDPFRSITFRQKESVHVGTHEDCAEHRDHYFGRARDLLTSLGLEVEGEVANDPFFGRAGRLMARGQRAAELKRELSVQAYGPGHPRTALASANLHGPHFAQAFDITLPDGSPAETACMGFGVERVALALLRAHGLDVREWPAEVRRELAL